MFSKYLNLISREVDVSNCRHKCFLLLAANHAIICLAVLLWHNQRNSTLHIFSFGLSSMHSKTWVVFAHSKVYFSFLAVCCTSRWFMKDMIAWHALCLLVVLLLKLLVNVELMDSLKQNTDILFHLFALNESQCFSKAKCKTEPRLDWKPALQAKKPGKHWLISLFCRVYCIIIYTKTEVDYRDTHEFLVFLEDFWIALDKIQNDSYFGKTKMNAKWVQWFTNSGHLLKSWIFIFIIFSSLNIPHWYFRQGLYRIRITNF